jgi:phosphohistidine phosphatase
MTPDGHCRLILTRHAKSDWDHPEPDDHERPLNGRGKRAARELGEWLASRDYVPDEVLCSNARRTAETWEIVAGALPGTPKVKHLAKLYHATPGRMMEALKMARGRTVMMLGHNPGIAAFAARLPARPPAHPDFARYPTAATLVVDFQIADWSEVEPGAGSAMDFFLPAERG